jgi:hypothetical protein
MSDSDIRLGSPSPAVTSPWPRRAAVVVFLATVGQLVVATFVSGLPQFEGKGFGARLVAYPVMMLFVPALWAAHRRWRTPGEWDAQQWPWLAFALIMAPFLIDVTGNTLNLYDSVGWWDDANHFANWFLLCTGIGLLLRSRVQPAWALGVLIAGVGALLAIGWEVGEWYAFIRHGTELDTAYEDTLFDEVLGASGAALAGFVVARRSPNMKQP